MSVLFIVLLAVAAAGGTYLLLERSGRRGLPAAACRAVAWAALGLLVLNLSCPDRAGAPRPLVLLDASLSMAAAGGQWAAARDSAARWGEVRLVGGLGPDSMPTAGTSQFNEALGAAAATARPVIVVTDGEIEDATDLHGLLPRAAVRLFPRAAIGDVAVWQVTGPSRVTAGDSLRLAVELRRHGALGADSTDLLIRWGTRVLGRQRVALPADRSQQVVTVSSRGLPAGDHILEVVLLPPPGDAESRDDVRWHRLTVAATPGVVLLASPGDWDSRFLFRTLSAVADLPVRGYVRLSDETWRDMVTLAPVTAAAIRQAVRGADLLILKGDPGASGTATRARGIWRWPSGERGETVLPGDWYLSAVPTAPMAGAFLGASLDSFPPATGMTPLQPAKGDWVALVGQESRRGAPRPAVLGGVRGNRREVMIAVQGLWRWAFRGGGSAQAYRAWVAATASWLLSAPDSAVGRARPLRPVVARGRPMVFQWTGSGPIQPVAVALEDQGVTRHDTLRFDGAGRAELVLPVGRYRYRLDGGGTGTVAVEPFSPEWFPRPVALAATESVQSVPLGRTAVRDWLWLFAVAILGLSGEWYLRRRLGLR